jgi:hypothetical protein
MEVESWTTAVVLRFLIGYRQSLQLALQEEILDRYHAERKPPAFINSWPDLDSIVPSASRQRALFKRRVPKPRIGSFTRLVDPTPGNSVVKGVAKDILRPTLGSVSERPGRTSSFLLYGPPGTRKTTFVGELAKVLDWPLVTLSPPAFLREGIEGFERSADLIFDDLQRLQRVVVLFDECEEFFRWRSSDTSPESRTVGAFITSGMLPRLQRLHDRKWVIFAINTNVEAFELDEAVTRRGRMDKANRIGHPSLEAQLRFLRRWRGESGQRLRNRHLRWFAEELGEIDRRVQPFRTRYDRQRERLQRENPDRGDEYRLEMARLHRDEARDIKSVVTFIMLDTLAHRCVSRKGSTAITRQSVLRKNLRQEFRRFGPDSWIHE